MKKTNPKIWNKHSNNNPKPNPNPNPHHCALHFWSIAFTNPTTLTNQNIKTQKIPCNLKPQPTITNQTNQPTNPAIRNPHEHIKPPSTITATDQSIKPPQPTPTTNPSNNPPPPTIEPTTTSQPLIQERALEIFPYLRSERGTLEL